MLFAITMMSGVLSGSGTPSFWENLVVLPVKLYSRVYFNEKIDKDWHEQCPSQDVTANNVESKIGKENEGQAFGDGKLVGDLGMDFLMTVMRNVKAIEKWYLVECEVNTEEESVV